MLDEAMGPLPATTDCTCHICFAAHPGERLDDEDRAVVDTVLRHGWQVTLVADGADGCAPAADGAHGPAFAYTIGLTHRTGHPELAVSGLAPQVMHRALNYVAAAVLRGYRLQPGGLVEGALANVPLTVDAVSDEGLSEIGLWSSWFHRRQVEALQLVWPSTDGIFAWQPGGAAVLDERQPIGWRVPSTRTGGVAVDPPWPLPIPPDAKVLTCVHVRGQGAPVRFVARQAGIVADEDWTFHCGGTHGDDLAEITVEHAAHAVRSAPSVREVANLGLGECAGRRDAFSPWRRGVR